MDTEYSENAHHVPPTIKGKSGGRQAEPPDLFIAAVKLNIATLFNRILVMLQINDLRRARDHLEMAWKLVEQLHDDRIHAEYFYWHGMIEITSNNEREACLAFLHAVKILGQQSHTTRTWVHYLQSHLEMTTELISEHTTAECEAQHMTDSLQHFLERYKNLEDNGPLPVQAHLFDAELSTLLSAWRIGTKSSPARQQSDVSKGPHKIVGPATESNVQLDASPKPVCETGQVYNHESREIEDLTVQPVHDQENESTDPSSSPVSGTQSSSAALSLPENIRSQGTSKWLREYSPPGLSSTIADLNDSALSPQSSDSTLLATDPMDPDAVSFFDDHPDLAQFPSPSISRDLKSPVRPDSSSYQDDLPSSSIDLSNSIDDTNSQSNSGNSGTAAVQSQVKGVDNLHGQDGSALLDSFAPSETSTPGNEERDELYETLLRQISRNSSSDASGSPRREGPDLQQRRRPPSSETPILPPDSIDEFNRRQLIMTGRRRIDQYLNLGPDDLDRSRRQSLDDIDRFNESQLYTRSRRMRRQAEALVGMVVVEEGVSDEKFIGSSPGVSTGNLGEVSGADRTREEDCDDETNQQDATPVDSVEKTSAESGATQEDIALSDTLMPREIVRRAEATSPSKTSSSSCTRRRTLSASVALDTGTMKKVVYQQISRRSSLEPRSPTSPLALSVSSA